MIISQKTTLKPSVRHGYGAILMVLFTGIISLILLQHSYDISLRSLETQKKAQLQLDYNQKEQAFLTTLVGLTPKFLANNMIDDSLVDNASTDLQTTTEELANETALISKLRGSYSTELRALGLVGSRNGNTGQIARNARGRSLLGIIHPMRNPPGWAGRITRRSNIEYPPIMAVRGSNISPLTPLLGEHSIETQRDNRNGRLFISSSYTYNNTSGATRNLRDKLLADHVEYADFNLLRYPNISFGYAEPGEPFVARQNWWRLFMQTEIDNSANTGLVANAQGQTDRNLNFIDREYILSAYEIPSQLAVNSNTFTQLGSFADGSSWAAAAGINITGGVYAERLETSGTITADRISTKQTSNFGGNVTVAGTINATNAITTATETAYENQNLNFFPIAKSSDSSKSIFVGLGQGTAFFDRFEGNMFAPNPSAGNRASYEHFFEYSRGCHQTAMKLDIIEIDGSTPIALQFTYIQNNGATNTITYGGSRFGPVPWPRSSSSFPFTEGVLPTGEVTINIHLDRIVSFLATLPNAAGVDVNHSITVNPDHRDLGIDETGLRFAAPVIPTPRLPDGSFPAPVFPYIVLDGTEDLTAYTSGFSFVSNLRTYFRRDFNIVPYPAGIPPRPGFTGTLYPPTSVFAPEIRYGTAPNAGIDIQGSVGSLATGNASGINILDLQGSQNTTDTATVSASLSSITHPAQLPPVNVMNWLIVVNRVIK